MAGVVKPKKAGRNYQFWFRDYRGRRKWGTGTKSRTETLAIARRMEDEHRQIRLGYRDLPVPKRKDRSFSEVRDEYLAWGDAQGGRGGRPWSPGHSRMRHTHLTWWTTALSLQTMKDLEGILPRVEEALREMTGAPKTIATYGAALRSFCRWAVDRDYLDENPLKKLSRLDTTPVKQRRALTVDEISRLLEACDPERRLTYEVAFTSGLRAGELGKLQVRHLDVEGKGLRLEAAWTKNRKPGFQPLPRSLIESLQKASAGKAADDSLLYVPSHPARDLDKDLKLAGIPKETPEGKADFHACRNAYITLVDSVGASWNETRELARHATLDMTGRYARTRNQRIQKVVEDVGAKVLGRARSRIPSETTETRPAEPSAVRSGAPDSVSSGQSEAIDGHEGCCTGVVQGSSVSDDDSAKEKGRNDLSSLRPCLCSGGGGNRTRVPDLLHKSVYVHSPSFESHARAPTDRVPCASRGRIVGGSPHGRFSA